MKYVPTCFFDILQTKDPEKMAYTEKMHHLFLKNVNTKDYDGFIFGGTDTAINFFTVVLFLDKKEVFIFDPLQFLTTIPAVANFLQLLFQYSDCLDSGDGQPAFSKDYTLTKVEQKNWTVFNVQMGNKFMPHKGDGYNCGLDLIMLCEAFIRGFLPAYDSKMLKSICDNVHLISSLASDIPLLGEHSLYPVQLYNKKKLNKIQNSIYKLIPEQFVFMEDTVWPLEGTPYVSCYTEELYPYESYYFHKQYKISGKRFCIAGDKNCLFIAMNSLSNNASSINGFMHILQKVYLMLLKTNSHKTSLTVPKMLEK